MPDLLCANVVSDAYFEDPAVLDDAMHRRGDRLGARMLWSARPGDAVLLSAVPTREFLTSVAEVLGHRPEIVQVHRPGRVTLPQAALTAPPPRAAGRTLVPYAPSADVYDLAAALGAGVRGPSARFARDGRIRAINAKTVFRRLAPLVDVPCCPGRVVPASATRRPVVTGPDPLIVKQRLSGGGLGNTVVPPYRAIDLPPSPPLVIERFLELRSWPSADFEVTADRRVLLRQLSTMRITDHAYDGVAIPPDGAPDMALRALITAGRALGRWWARRGFRGWYDIDGGVTSDGRLVVTEINGRCTGGTPIDAIGRALFGPAYPARCRIRGREHLSLYAAPDAAIRRARARGLLATRDHPYGIVPLWESPEERALGYLAIGADDADVTRIEARWLDTARAASPLHPAREVGHARDRAGRGHR